ncbi:MAG: hypothetical protein ACREJO_18360 [Phycisphaerales bacterium]
MLFLRAHDADSRRVPVMARSLLVLARRTAGTSRGRGGAARGAWRWALTGAPVVVLAVVLLLGASATLMLRGDPAGLWLLLFTPIASSLMYVILRSFVVGGGLWDELGQRAAGAMLAERRCPRCGYDLGGQPVREGVVRCPECASAWREGEVGVDEPPEPTVVVVKHEPR